MNQRDPSAKFLCPKYGFVIVNGWLDMTAPPHLADCPCGMLSLEGDQAVSEGNDCVQGYFLFDFKGCILIDIQMLY